jgi:hypothetical protein
VTPVDGNALLPCRHALLTIRNLTPCTAGFIERLIMNVVTVKRTVIHGVSKKPSMKRTVINGRPKKISTIRRSFRELTGVISQAKRLGNL